MATGIAEDYSIRNLYSYPKMETQEQQVTSHLESSESVMLSELICLTDLPDESGYHR